MGSRNIAGATTERCNNSSRDLAFLFDVIAVVIVVFTAL